MKPAIKTVAANAPHIQQARSVRAIMMEVCAALIPAALFYVYLFGPGLIFNAVVAVLTALGCEFLMLRLRQHEVRAYLGDFSAVLAALLIAFALPPLCPWWVTVVATSFAIVVAKHVYGGLGFNTFNPAMAGYALVLISFPKELALWSTRASHGERLGFFESLGVNLTGKLPDALSWDMITSATPLDVVQTGLARGRMLSEMMAGDTLHQYGTADWLMINLLILAGGLWLIYRGIIRWHIPVYLLAGLFVTALIFRVYDSDGFASPLFHLFSGSTMLAAFFIATDPVTAATSTRGRIIYAFSIGSLVYVIRTWGSYPDGIAFAVLFLNMLVPLIDYFTIPRSYGHASK